MWCFLSLRLWLIFSFALSFVCGCSLLCLFQCTWILPCPVPLKTDLLTVLEAAHPYISSPPTAQNPITIRKEGKKNPSPVTFIVVTTEEWEVNCWQRPAQVLQLRSLWLTTLHSSLAAPALLLAVPEDTVFIKWTFALIQCLSSYMKLCGTGTILL